MKATDFLQNFPHKVDGGIAVKKRPNQTSDHELEVSMGSSSAVVLAISMKPFALWLIFGGGIT